MVSYMEDINAILEENGFSKAEAKVYLTLLKLGETRSGLIIKKTSLQSSVVHNALNTLGNKGFITHTIKGKTKHYQALDPKTINNYIETKQKSFLKILPELELLKKQSKIQITNVEVYEGYKGLFNATLRLLEESKRGQTYKYFASSESLLTKEAIEFFSKIDSLKKEKGLMIKGIANKETKEKLKTQRDSIIRYTSQNIPPAMNIFGDKVLLMVLSEKPITIYIQSKEIADQYHKMWDEIWEKSKSIERRL
ncbi:MAG: helix-turn-helix domain-containing protein [archaeon]